MVNLQHRKAFIKYIQERHNIWHKKEAQKLPPPWTGDEVMRKYKFCNVFIEQDAGSRYIAGKIAEADGFNAKMGRLILFRIVNNPAFFEACGFPNFTSLESINGHVSAASHFNRKIVGDAYLRVWSVGYGHHHKEQYQGAVYDLVAQINHLPLWLEEADSRKKVWDFLKTLGCGCGSFIAFVIIEDMVRNGLLVAPDDWVFVGPGAKWSLAQIYGDERGEIAQCADLRDYCNEKIKLPRPLDLMDIEHNLCEYRKWFALTHGERNVKKRPYIHKQPHA